MELAVRIPMNSNDVDVALFAKGEPLLVQRLVAEIHNALQFQRLDKGETLGPEQVTPIHVREHAREHLRRNDGVVRPDCFLRVHRITGGALLGNAVMMM